MSEPTHRRAFVRSLALGASAGLIASSPLRADDDKDKEKAKEQDKPKEEPKPRSELDARMELIVARYGKHLDESQRTIVRREVQGLMRRAEALKKFSLTNGDEPVPIFVPYRGPLG